MGKRSERREGLKEEDFNTVGFLMADQKGRRWTKEAKARQSGTGLLVNYYNTTKARHRGAGRYLC
jgi:hypothetical protein